MGILVAKPLYVNLENIPVNAFSLFSPGKVHGSLARAGKVRGQTPKVKKINKNLWTCIGATVQQFAC